MEQEKTRIPLKTQIVKYSLQGIVFSILYNISAIIWVFIFNLLITVGLFVVLLIGIVLLFLIVGALNAILTELIWNEQIDYGWQSILTSGFFVFSGLVLVHIPSAVLLMYYTPDVFVLIALFVIHMFVDGFLAKELAPIFEGKNEEMQIK